MTATGKANETLRCRSRPLRIRKILQERVSRACSARPRMKVLSLGALATSMRRRGTTLRS